jgi:5'-3' exonuclease
MQDNIPGLPGVGEVTAKNSWQNMGLWKIFYKYRQAKRQNEREY